MNKLFEISKIPFYKEDFQDNVEDFQDIIPIIQDFENYLKLEKIQCTDKNDCCYKTKENYIAEIIGVLTEDDDFYSLEEVRARESEFRGKRLDPFGIQVYKCLSCGKWIINILE